MLAAQRIFKLILLCLTLETLCTAGVVNDTNKLNRTEIQPILPEGTEQVKAVKENSDSQFWIAFVKAFSIIFVSEIADKSFIMVLYFTIVSKKINSIFIFIASSLALILMCVLSVAVGYAMPLLLNKSILEWIAIVVFSLFGIFTLYQGSKMKYDDTVSKKVQQAAKVGINKSSGEEEHKDEHHQDKDLKTSLLQKNEEHEVEEAQINKDDDEKFNSSFWLTLWSMFSLVILAEWGDKTMFSTIMIASVFNVQGVFFGAVTSYLLTCSIAVLAGKFFGKYLNEKIMCYIGGVIFLCFALQYLIEKLFFS